MRKKTIPILLIWMMLATDFGMASVVAAEQCLDTSPPLSAGKRIPDRISIRVLTDTEYQQVKTLLKSLDGRWKGRATVIGCNMADLNDQDISHYTTKAKAKASRSGDLLIEAEFYAPEEHTTHQETQRFYLSGKYLRIHHDSGAGDVELIHVSANKIELRYNVRTRNSAGRLTHNEFFYRLSTGSGGFSIFRKTYTHQMYSIAILLSPPPV